MGGSSSCGCPSQFVGGAGKSGYQVFSESGQVRWVKLYATALTDPQDPSLDLEESKATAQLWDSLLSTLCEVGEVGDMFTSASPADPLFWVVHPTLDRLWSWRRQSSRVFDETWGYAHNNLTASDNPITCDWEGVGADTMPVCSVDQVCSGHKRDDPLPIRFDHA